MSETRKDAVHEDAQVGIPGSEVDAQQSEQIIAHEDFFGRSIGEVLTDISRIADDNKLKGTRFERLTQTALPLIPELDIERVISPPENDIGIDLIATRKNGDKIAIQCKFYTARSILWGDISTFIGAAKQKGIAEKWLVCGGKRLSKNIDPKGKGFGDVRIVDFRVHAKVLLSLAETAPREPRALQKEAIDKVLQGFRNAEAGEHGDRRGKLIMACGTGKTFTALRIAEQLVPAKKACANILFIAPSISLVAQARSEWLQHTIRRMRSLVICSDQSAAYDEEIQHNEIPGRVFAGKVTTDAENIAVALGEEIPRDAARVTFCTYQSLDKVYAAQSQYDAPKFDLAIVDEAHRTTGVVENKEMKQFLLIHDAQKIQANYRLYMTATPRVYAKNKARRTAEQNPDISIVDFDDPVAYGNQFCHITFKQAVEAKMLCDYRVIALGVTESIIAPELMDDLLALNDEVDISSKSAKGKTADAQSVLALGAIALAINGYLKGQGYPQIINRTIAFASNIRRSKWLELALNNERMRELLASWVTATARRESEEDAQAVNIGARHLDGTNDAVTRTNALQWLHEASEIEPRLITNAQLFTEGVDVPALNAIAFLDPRKSKIDTVQAVGRVMRRDPDNPDKEIGYIIVPVILPPGDDLLTTLQKDKARFQSLGNVLQALRSHDERFSTELHLLLGEVDSKVGKGVVPGDESEVQQAAEIQESLLDESTSHAIFAQLAKFSGISDVGRHTADDITVDINRAGAILQEVGAAEIIAAAIGTPTDKPSESCKTAALLIVNACIMHKRLEDTGNLRGLADLQTISNSGAKFMKELFAAWRTILSKDYAPIFADAALLIKRFARYKRMYPAIRILINRAISSAATLNDLGFDHAGPLYHKVLGSAQSDGAFYTRNLSAYLLAGLSFNDTFTDWKDATKVKKLRLADPACGTGTLLMAALKVIKDRAIKAQNLTPAQAEKLHKHLVEKSIHGYDINQYSVQLAACNLTIGALNTDYAGMNLRTLQYGPLPNTSGEKMSEVAHGALEILLGKTDAKLLQTQLFEDEEIYAHNVERQRAKFRAPESLDAIIYNPPFTDTQLQGGKYNSAVKTAMDDRLQHIKSKLQEKDPAAADAIAKRSIQPYFQPLTNRLLAKEKGTLAEVKPTTACVAENARAQRQYLAANFHIEMVVTSHDPKHVNFSANTSIHECLVIARRSWHKSDFTRFIQLAKFPADTADVEKLIAAIESGEADGWYTETLWPREKVAAGDWTPVQWMNSQLAHAAAEIETITKLEHGSRYSWQPQDVAISPVFKYEKSEDGDLFCTINEGLMQTIAAKPESKSTVRAGKEKRAEALWAKADHVLITTRFRTTSTRLIALYSEQAALGAVYQPIGVYDKEIAKAFVAFLNSSFGVLQMLHRRSRTLDYPRYRHGELRTLRLPDPEKVDLDALVEEFERVKDTPLKRLAECDTDEARRILDYTAADALADDKKKAEELRARTDEWREWLSREPTITNRAVSVGGSRGGGGG